MKYTDLERLAKQDRFAWIFKERYETEVLAFIPELCCHSHTTGILIEREDALQTPKVFYHATLQRNVQGILDQGFILKNFMPDPSSFGQDVVYTFADISRLAGAEAIVAVTYRGPYLEAIAEWDKDDCAQHSCMLYPEYIQSIASMTDLSKPQRTNAFGDSCIERSCTDPTPLSIVYSLDDILYRVENSRAQVAHERKAQYDKLLSQPFTEVDLQNAAPCGECGGECCKKMGCHYSPEDFGDITFESLRTIIDQGHVSIDWYNGEFDDNTQTNRQYYLRARHINSPVVDPSFGGKCVCLTLTGCSLEWNERPRGGRYLQARKDWEDPCVNRYSKEECARDWLQYESILVALVDYFGGAYEPDLTDVPFGELDTFCN